MVSNGDNLVTTLAQGETALLDHRLMSPTMMPQTVLIEFMEQKEGARLDRIDTKASVQIRLALSMLQALPAQLAQAARLRRLGKRVQLDRARHRHARCQPREAHLDELLRVD